jgi:hypothetical protein
MALTWESIPYESFKYMWRSQYGTTTFAMDIHALSAAVFDYSLLLNVCNFNAADILPLEPKGWEGESSLGLFNCEYPKVLIKD